MRIPVVPLLVISLFTATPAFAEQASKSHVIKELEVEGAPLSTVIEQIREQDPSFQAVIAYAPGVKEGGPVIQELRLKNVTAQAALELLAQSYGAIRVSQVSGPENTILYSIRVERSEGDDRVDTQKPITVVHRLRELIDGLAESGKGEEGRKKACASILSLVQTTIETDGGEKAAGLRIGVHEETETLVFRGNYAQAELVERALLSLRPIKDDLVAAVERKAADKELRVQRLEEEMEEIDRQRRKLMDKVPELTAEIERLRVRVEDAEKRAAAAERRTGVQTPDPQPQPTAKPKQP